MLIVSTNISDIFTMAESENNIEDLEDGEIESEGEGEEANQTVNDVNKEEPFPQEQLVTEKVDENFYYSKSGKKKKSKSNKGEQKYKDKSRKNRKYAASPEDDHAGKIEKAIRKAMNKNDYDQGNVENDLEDRRKHKKRKKYEGEDSSSKKRKKQDYSDEVDESEMMCIRGASPILDNKGMSTDNGYPDDDRDSYASDSSHSSRDHQSHRLKRHRQPQRERNKNKSDRRRNAHPMQDPDGVCLYYMQGKCHKGDDCIYSHDAQPPRKMELCKFYLMDCCAKRDKCLYMHSDFPCKYYHTGLPCVYKDECKFAHGKPLSEVLKTILLKHIESAPKEILGDFPRLNREGALKMIQTTQTNLRLQYPEVREEKSIPSLFELNIPNPHISSESVQPNNDKQSKVSPKIRQSRWQNENSNQNFSTISSPNSNSGAQNVLNIKNLTGVLTPRQILDLTKMGIENLDQLGQLTVLQLNGIGISLKQISEIQLNTMSIQKLGLINPNGEQQSQYISPLSGTKDLDLRVPPMLPCNNVPVSTDLLGKDVDMRFQPTMKLAAEVSTYKAPNKDLQENKDMIDIDQYTKDALKFLSKDKENIDISNECFDDEKPTITNESKDVDHRVMPFSEDSSVNLHISGENNLIKKDCDTDIRFHLPEPAFKSPEKRYRRSTTDDDEDNNLLIDEKWYSSDEEKNNKRKSPSASPQQIVYAQQTPTRNTVEPSSFLSKLGDLSKIDISEEVTKLLNTMKNNLQDKKVDSITESPDTRPSKDPRVRRSPDKVSDSSKPSHRKSPRVSIYECVDGEPTDGRRRTDVDLRPDYKIPTFGDTDLRQSSSGDIDFRLGLPFKAIPNYTPASEIDGSYNSHPPITYKLVPIDIPRPDYTDIRNSTAKSQALLDPRLRKVFRLSLDESSSDNEKPTKAAAPSGPRIDPRRKPKEITETITQDQKQNSLDLQSILQNSDWYKELSTNNKIFVNQNLAPVTQMIKQFQQEKTPGKKLDLTPIQSNNVLCSIFANLGISLAENGEFSYLPKPKEALLKTPTIFNQNASPFGMNNNMPMPPGMDAGPMNMMNMPPLGMGGGSNMNNMHMHGYNQNFPDPRGGPTPGLLGIAPNIPHNFNNNFGGPNNFGNMPFNSPAQGNDFGYGNRGAHRGRGNDRWNRGVSGRGNRKNFNDRGNWKNDRN